MASGFFVKYDNKKPFCLAANLSMHICKSEGTYQSFTNLSVCLSIKKYFHVFLPILKCLNSPFFCGSRSMNCKDLVLYSVFNDRSWSYHGFLVSQTKKILQWLSFWISPDHSHSCAPPPRHLPVHSYRYSFFKYGTAFSLTFLQLFRQYIFHAFSFPAQEILQILSWELCLFWRS